MTKATREGGIAMSLNVFRIAILDTSKVEVFGIAIALVWVSTPI